MKAIIIKVLREDEDAFVLQLGYYALVMLFSCIKDADFFTLSPVKILR